MFCMHQHTHTIPQHCTQNMYHPCGRPTALPHCTASKLENSHLDICDITPHRCVRTWSCRSLSRSREGCGCCAPPWTPPSSQHPPPTPLSPTPTHTSPRRVLGRGPTALSLHTAPLLLPQQPSQLQPRHLQEHLPHQVPQHQSVPMGPRCGPWVQRWGRVQAQWGQVPRRLGRPPWVVLRLRGGVHGGGRGVALAPRSQQQLALLLCLLLRAD